MPTYNVEPTKKVCHDCVNGSKHKLLRITETWDPFPGEDPKRDIVYLRCSNPSCDHEVVAEDYMFGRNTPFVRPRGERFANETLRLMRGYGAAMSELGVHSGRATSSVAVSVMASA